MTAEHSRIQPFEKITVAPQITVAELIGQRPLSEPRRLSLLDAPLFVASYETAPHTTQYAASLHFGLNDNQFMDFLKKVAPDPTGDLRVGVIVDWQLPDSRGNKENERLKDIHGALGESWIEFERHRRKFIGALTPPQRSPFDHEIEYGKVLDNDHSRNILRIKRREPVEIKYVEGFGPDAPNITGFVKPKRGHEIKPIEEQESPRDIYTISTPNSTAEGYFSVYTAHPRTIFGSEKLHAQFIPIGETVKKKNNLLIPLLHWERTGTDRRWLFDTPTLGMAKACDVDTLPNTTTSDTLMGLLALAYFAPDVVSKWPKEMGLPDSDIKQQMGSAQVPLLAQIRSRDLLQTPLISSIEQYAQQAA